MEKQKYSIGEVAKEVGCTRRTIRYYVQRGLIPPPEGTGRHCYYNNQHLVLIKSIKKMQQEYLPLEKIKERLKQGHIQESIDIDSNTVPDALGISINRERFVRVNVTPELEIHFKEYLPGTDKEKIEKLLSYARELFYGK